MLSGKVSLCASSDLFEDDGAVSQAMPAQSLLSEVLIHAHVPYQG